MMLEMAAGGMSQVIAYREANPIQRVLRRAAASGPGSWVSSRLAHRIDRPIHRLTRGRATFSSAVSGLPVVMLTTTGARSRQRRTVPVLGLPTSDGFAIVASNWGKGRHPAWYHNLRAHPSAEIAVGRSRSRVRAVQVEDERRERIWRAGMAVYPGFSQYERRAPDRRIPVFLLEPE
jgi:deazaflavin-dependent oxidoreductase (nitroreductase family)